MHTDFATAENEQLLATQAIERARNHIKQEKANARKRVERPRKWTILRLISRLFENDPVPPVWAEDDSPPDDRPLKRRVILPQGVRIARNILAVMGAFLFGSAVLMLTIGPRDWLLCLHSLIISVWVFRIVREINLGKSEWLNLVSLRKDKNSK